MKYELQFLQQAADDLERLDRVVSRRVFSKLQKFTENFEVESPQPLAGDLAGLFKLRIGDYRAIYEIDRRQHRIIVHMVGHRREIYRHS